MSQENGAKVLRVWTMSLDDFSHVHLECPDPLTAGEVEDTLAFLDIAREQIARFALRQRAGRKGHQGA